MADVKWIKITTDMFDNRKIKHLRRLPDGNNIVLIWVMLLTMAGRCNANGMVFLTENIPYTPKMLADELDFEENTVILALKALENLNMIVTDSGFFSIAGWQEYQNIDGMDKIREQNRIRQQRWKEKQKALGSGAVCQYCGGVATGYDHIIATSRGGSDADENKVPCCVECNRIKNDKPLIDFLNFNRERIRDDLIIQSEKLSKYVTLDNVTDRYLITQGNATEEDIEEDKDIEKDKELYRSIISYLNEKAGTNYKPTTAKTKSAINARLSEGFKIDDFKTVIDKKCAEWIGDPKMEKYLRPETLFGTKFEGYLNAKISKTARNQRIGANGIAISNEKSDLEGVF